VLRQAGDGFVSSFGFYPDPDCRQLKKALADRYGVPMASLYCGSGADDVFYRLILSLRPRKALVIEPTFEEYAVALSLVDCEIIHCQLSMSDGFSLDMDRLLSLAVRQDIVIVCNPNNPTGTLIPRKELLELISICEANDTVCVVDECLMEMMEDWRQHTVRQEVENFCNLVVIDAFTKTYALAGLRLGFVITGHEGLVEKMQRQGQAFNVSSPAQFAGILALSDAAPYLSRTYVLLAQERMFLSLSFKRLHVQFFPTVANFFLVKSSVAHFNEKLLLLGIKARDCTKFYGLDASYSRLAIRTHEENIALVKALEKILESCCI
jgi:threonine-phosphate decarboxylase